MEPPPSKCCPPAMLPICRDTVRHCFQLPTSFLSSRAHTALTVSAAVSSQPSSSPTPLSQQHSTHCSLPDGKRFSTGSLDTVLPWLLPPGDFLPVAITSSLLLCLVLRFPQAAPGLSSVELLEFQMCHILLLIYSSTWTSGWHLIFHMSRANPLSPAQSCSSPFSS